MFEDARYFVTLCIEMIIYIHRIHRERYYITTNRESGTPVTIAGIRFRVENIGIQESWTIKEEVGCLCSFLAFADTYLTIHLFLLALDGYW